MTVSVHAWLIDACPRCKSTNVYVGNHPLECLACGWHYLDGFACRVCGKPARSVMGNNQGAAYGCGDHPFTADEVREAFRGFVAVVREAT